MFCHSNVVLSEQNMPITIETDTDGVEYYSRYFDMKLTIYALIKGFGAKQKIIQEMAWVLQN